MHSHLGYEHHSGRHLVTERAALDRWNKGDVEGCLEVYAEDASYFDPIMIRTRKTVFWGQ